MQQFTIPCIPQQNGVAERKNRTLVECTHSMLKSKGWVEAINTTIYLRNRSPTKYLSTKHHLKHFMVLNLKLFI